MTQAINPALVTSDAVQRLPRAALLIFCAAYLIPGAVGRAPWRGADITAFGQMLAIAEGRAPWTDPMLGGVSTGAALLPVWLGAAAIRLTAPWLDPALAARLPFVALLGLALAAVWYAAYHLARGERAQPLPLVFGGGADPVSYARAIADGALLALIATLGLLQLGHETTPELVQLTAIAVAQWAVAAAPQRRAGSRIGVLVALPALAASGAPTMALLFGCGALGLSLDSSERERRAIWPWLLGALCVAAAVAVPMHGWSWRLDGDWQPWPLIRLWLWFLWPAWVLALWTLWQWRRQLRAPHLALPLLGLALALLASIAMGGSDRALLLGLPGCSVLAALALPTLRRGASAAIDWFSVFFFSAAALVVWIYFLGMQLGIPAVAAATVQRLAPGFELHLPWLAWAAAALATTAWAWLVRWRTRRHRAVIWKSLVLPAGGVALGWILTMSLWLPLLDYARSNRPLAQRLARHLDAGQCVAVPQGLPSVVVALEYHLHRKVDARAESLADTRCPFALVVIYDGVFEPRIRAALDRGWSEVARVWRPTDRRESTIVLQRQQVKPANASPGDREPPAEKGRSARVQSVARA